MSDSEETIDIENQKLMAAFAEQEKNKVDPDKLAALKAKLAKKEEEEMPVMVAPQKNVSINLGIIGVGQAGSRIAEQFHKLGYDVGVINTSAQDLEYIDVLPYQKLLLEGSLGGTGKDLGLSREIFLENERTIENFISKVAETSDMLVVAAASGGGTGAGSLDVIIPLLFRTGLPVGVIFVLPKATEDAQSKRNSIETMARVAKLTSEDQVSCLVMVDNARIEQIYGNLSQAEFWKTSNQAIVEPISIFNSLTCQPSQFTSLDPSDFGKIISCGDCSIYGVIEVEDYMEEIALADAVVESLSNNMLAEGFDLSQTRTGGVIIVGSENALNKLPALNIDYAFSMISEITNGANIFQGIYAQEDIGDKIRIYSWFAGLGLPQDRIENLKKESQEQAAVLAGKEKQRTAAMTLDLGENKVATMKEEVHRKIQSKKSGFGKLQGSARTNAKQSIIDKRRR